VSLNRPLTKFSADRPIQSTAEDLLGRTKFAESLGQIVKGWTGNDSLVTPLFGPWGIGKSSLKNMVLEYLRRDGNGSPTIVQFTPWQWAAQDQISEAFFSQIALSLGKKDEAKVAKNRATRFAAYAAYTKVGNHLASGVRPLLAIALASAGVLGVGNWLPIHLWLNRISPIIGCICFVLAALFGWSADFAERLQQRSQRRVNSKKKI